MKIFLHVCFILLSSVARGAVAPTYKLFDQPLVMSDKDATILMLENLGFKLGEEKGYKDLGHDLLLRIDKKGMERFHKGKQFSGFWNVDGGKDVEIQVMLLTEPAKVRLSPEGEVSGTWEAGTPVKLLRAKDDWRLISNSQKIWAWTELKTLKALPKKQLLLVTTSKMAKEYPQSIGHWIDLKTQIDTYRKMAENKICPPNLTEADRDLLLYSDYGISTVYANSNNMVTHFRSEAVMACVSLTGVRDPIKLTRVQFPKMVSKDCSCFTKFPAEPYEAFTVTNGSWAAHSTNSCELLQFHYSCTKNGATEESWPYQLICPVRCFRKAK